MQENKTLELTTTLVGRPSVTPDDAGCQDILAERLEALGFRAHRLQFGDVSNLWAERGEGKPLVVFAGHTDVVPPGPSELWDSDPFVPEIRDGHLYGRGAADMKSSLAAFVTAVEDYIERTPAHKGSIGFLITSDEEGVARDGTRRIVDWLRDQGKQIDYCVVGEPSSVETLGDEIKNGRRGSLNGALVVHGVQGHVAYPHQAKNPIHVVAPVLAELVAAEWDQGTEQFPPTTFQVSNVRAGTGADNVIPASLELEFNLRYSTAVTEESLQERIEALLERHGLSYTLNWRHSGAPFLTPVGVLIEAMRMAIRDELGRDPILSTAGGTSDARFIAPTGAEVVEFGPINRTIHHANECVAVADLPRLGRIYAKVLAKLLK
ncbi:MAG: succinyl-diaminopimelate desuccinylase [Acidiferrobacterales bacterium]